MKYIITWRATGNEGYEMRYCICDSSSIEHYLSEIAGKTGGWGNDSITCYELGKKIKWTKETVCKIS